MANNTCNCAAGFTGALCDTASMCYLIILFTDSCIFPNAHFANNYYDI